MDAPTVVLRENDEEELGVGGNLKNKVINFKILSFVYTIFSRVCKKFTVHANKTTGIRQCFAFFLVMTRGGVNLTVSGY